METRGEVVGLSEMPMVGQEEARSEAGRGAPACAGAPEREGGMEGGAEQRQAWLLRELQGVNRQLSHEVSTLANENLRLKVAQMAEKPNAKLEHELEVLARAEKSMMINAPGFAPAWETAKAAAAGPAACLPAPNPERHPRLRGAPGGV